MHSYLKFSEFLSLLNESKSPLLNACEKVFSHDVVFNTRMSFELTNANIQKLFNIVDDYLFHGKLSTLRNLDVIVGSSKHIAK